MIDDKDEFGNCACDGQGWSEEKLQEYLKGHSGYHKYQIRKAIREFLAGLRGPLPCWIPHTAPLHVWLRNIKFTVWGRCACGCGRLMERKPWNA